MMGGFRLKFPRSPRRRHSPTNISVWNPADSRDSDSSGSSQNSAAEFHRASSDGTSTSTTYRITIPDHVAPGQSFQVAVGRRVIRVRCPLDSRPRQSLQLRVPAEDGDEAGCVDGAASQHESRSREPPTPDSDGVTPIAARDLKPGERAAYSVRIPEGVAGGERFPVTIGGQFLSVTCPDDGGAGMRVRVVPPPAPPPSPQRPPAAAPDSPNPPSDDGPDAQRFEVVVPDGVEPGKPFTLFAGGVRVLVTCPANARSGQRIQFGLPRALVAGANGPKGKLAKIKLSYDKDGWTRTVRAADLKFQWTRFDGRGNVDVRQRFDADRSAYVLKLDYLDDGRVRRGRVKFVAPEAFAVDSTIQGADGSELAGYSDIADAQVKSFDDKVRWFEGVCSRLRVDWNTRDYIKMNVRRRCLLSDSIDAVMSLSREEMRKQWRFNFVGEAGLDAGGLKREWFELVTREMFDPNLGLWQSSETNQMCLQINPASAICCPEDHLVCFRFIGRVMGKALLDGELVRGHMVGRLYKHLLGWPVMFNDLKCLDEVYFNSLNQLSGMGADVEYVYATFSTEEELLGMKQSVELVNGGSGIGVTEENLPEYLEACLKYRLLGRCEEQLRELLLGFYDVLPESLLTVFDFQELELLMCGLPEINMVDWMENTEYAGECDREGPNHRVCAWFWEVVGDYDHEMRARLLQFVTGTSGVPASGFSSLQSNGGEIRKFTIQGVDLNTCVFPRSHTCFNRIDLPMYKTKDELEKKLRIAVTMAATGFDIE